MAYIGNVPAEKYTALTQQTFSSPTGTSFTLSQAVTNSVDIDLYIDNVKQDPTTYSVSGTALTTSTIASPSTMYCIFNGKAMQTVNPPDDSVGLAQLAGGTDGNVITFDASGNPAYVATGTDGQVLTSTGAGSAPVFEALPSSGKVLQVVNSTYDTQVSSVGDTGLTASITPSSTSSKVLVFVSQNGCARAAHSAGGIVLILYRASTILCRFEEQISLAGSSAFITSSASSTTFLDSPSSTSSVTYKTTMGSTSGGMYVQYASAKSTMTLMEIGV
jgi:hypothetical protein